MAMNRKISLNGVWKLKFEDCFSEDKGEIPCTVPGNVELDLIKADLLPKDIFKGTNVKLAEKYETYQWEYSRYFDCPNPQGQYRIVFEGVDCLAEYYVNGEKIGESENMLVEHSFFLNNLKEKDNFLQVKIRSTVLACSEKEYPVRMLMGNWGGEVFEPVYLRRAAHTYCWDILPRAVSAGLWKGVYLEEYNPLEFKQFFITTKCIKGDVVRVFVAYEFDCYINEAKGYELEIRGVCGDSSFYHKIPVSFKAGSTEIYLHNPKLWWPFGYGEHNLYEVQAKLLSAKGEVLSETKTRMGIKTVKLSRTDTAKDGKFAFIVNGVEIYVRGMNWIPLSPYHSQDKERLPQAMQLLQESNSNMVRCWGGNVYESDEFLDMLDERGILLWQDFAFACTVYPQTEDFYAKVRDEADKVIKRMRNHACLALWAGDNEFDILYKDHLKDPTENYLTRSVLAEQVSLHDPWREYLPSSPYMTQKACNLGGICDSPEDHLWGARNFYKCDYFRKTPASFVSETGCIASANDSTLDKFISKECETNYFSKEWSLHSADNQGRLHRVKHLLKNVRIMFGEIPQKRSEMVEASQYYQAENAKYVIENMRAQKPDKSGVIWWNLLDGWPGNTEAVVDWYFQKKKAFDVIARSHKPFSLMIFENENGTKSLVAVNDTLQAKQTEYRIIDADSKEVLYEGQIKVEGNGKIAIPLCDAVYFEQRLWIIEWTENGVKQFNHYLCGNPVYALEKMRRWYGILEDYKQRTEKERIHEQD